MVLTPHASHPINYHTPWVSKNTTQEYQAPFYCSMYAHYALVTTTSKSCTWNVNNLHEITILQDRYETKFTLLYSHLLTNILPDMRVIINNMVSYLLWNNSWLGSRILTVTFTAWPLDHTANVSWPFDRTGNQPMTVDYTHILSFDPIIYGRKRSDSTPSLGSRCQVLAVNMARMGVTTPWPPVFNHCQNDQQLEMAKARELEQGYA